MSKTKNRNPFRRTSVVLALAVVVACATSPPQTCDVPPVERVIGAWDTLTPSSLSLINLPGMTAITEEAQNNLNVTTTNVYLGAPRGAACKCCVTLIFESSPAGTTLISALIVRRFQNRPDALTFARETWSAFAHSDISIDEERYLSMDDPYVTRSGSSLRAGRQFMGDLRIELERPSQVVVRFHLAGRARGAQ